MDEENELSEMNIEFNTVKIERSSINKLYVYLYIITMSLGSFQMGFKLSFSIFNYVGYSIGMTNCPMQPSQSYYPFPQ